jgi:GDP-mannose 6-dehydrogenase
VQQSNRIHIERAIAKVLDSGKRRIGVIGLAFKAGTDDLRESPMVLMAEHLIGKGLQLRIYDPGVHLSSLIGANRRYIEQHLPHIGTLVRNDIAAVIAESDVLVVGLGDRSVVAALAEHTRPGQVVVDLVGIGDRTALRGDYVGLCW